ncbi:DegT/DnrJ/EryC1/StrS family aminotransferase [Novosphingobium sp. BL-8A]|uniref:DegT/DnrJ/EryC1/StrS family aminotransferase n=1 Tax=Novosphingobium sp. BL-8A TaxID=3127639 RepID=UPI003757D84B
MELHRSTTDERTSAEDFSVVDIGSIGSAPAAKPARQKRRAPPIDLDDAPVTRPFLPPLDEFLPYLEGIWANRWLTNAGPYHQQFEEELAAYLGVDHLALTSNGTSALQLALLALDVTAGEVITTPFTFVATTHVLQLAGLQPVFVDIDPKTGNLDPEMVERAITPRTSAIMPVHCFGHPCRTDRIAEIADAHGLKVVYDGAHAFNVRRNGESLLRAGHATCLSFHATKVFNTFEGGAIVCDAGTKARIARLRNFGFSDAFSVDAIGTNAKMSEFQAAFGLVQLKHADHVIARRAAIAGQYSAGLRTIDGLALFEAEPGWQLNHSYFPILLDDGLALRRDELCARLLAAGIHARPYFWPLVCDHSVYRHLPSASSHMPVARSFAKRILCLPLYPDLAARHIETAVAIIDDFCARTRQRN